MTSLLRRPAITTATSSASTHGHAGDAFVRAASLLLLLAVCYIFSPPPSYAQSIQYTQDKADQTLRSDARVDPSTLGMSVQVPIRAYPGRGGASLPVTLNYSSKLWRINFYQAWNDNYHDYTESLPVYGEHSKSGWTSSLGVPYVEWTGNQQVYDEDGNPYCLGCIDTVWSDQFRVNRLSIHMPDGSSHELRLNDTVVTTLANAGVYYAVDGSRMKYDADAKILYLPDGSQYRLGGSAAPSYYIDRNGNTLTYSPSTRKWTDALNRALDVPLPETPAAQDYTYSVPGANGTPATYTLKWRNLSGVLTDPAQALRYTSGQCNGAQYVLRSPSLFAKSGFDRVCGNGQLFNPVVLSQVVLPNGSTYTFTYNVWGEIDKVVYPTGGYERFGYAAVNAVSYLKAPYLQGNRGVVDRWVSPSGSGTDEAHWQYASTGGDVTVTSPDGTRTERLLHTSGGPFENPPPYGFDDASVGMAYEERVYSPSGQMLRRTLTDWAVSGATPGGWSTATRDPRVTKEVSILLDTGGNASAATTAMQYDGDLNVTSLSRYDFTSVDQTTAQNGTINSFPSGALVRTEEATFLVNDPTIDAPTKAAYRARNLIALPTSTRVKDSSGAVVAQTATGYDEAAYPLLTYASVPGWTDPGTVARGNVTTSARWLNTTGGYLQTHARYDQCGSVRYAWDANNNWSQIEYSSAYAYAYPTSTTSPVPDPSGQHGSTVSLVTTSVYDVSTGLVTSTTDANNQTTGYAYNDPLGRLTTVTQPAGGGSTTYLYGDTPGNFYVRTRTTLDAARVVETYRYFDGLGRPKRSFINEGATYSVNDTQYDALGRAWRVSNPYRTSALTDPVNPSGNWTTTAYDALGRVLSVTTPDGAAVNSSYGGNQVTVTDQAGKARRSVSDALGRLSSVTEDPNGLAYQTVYGYDALDDLTTVTQGVQTRSFAYDSLKRLTSSTLPESGTTTYQYDDNGNLKLRQDARGVTTSVGYDALNRAKTRTYNDGTPAVNYYYDSVTLPTGAPSFDRGYATGQLVAVTYGGGSAGTYRGYDALGRTVRQVQQTDGVNYLAEASYYPGGALESETYPAAAGYGDRRVISYGYEAAGRLSSLTSAATSYGAAAGVSGISYAAHGSLSGETLGNGLVHAVSYNTRLQPGEIKLGTTGAPASVLDLVYGYGTTNNNGNIQSVTYGGGGLSYSQAFGYDSLNRLETAQETASGATSWAQTNGYDRYGNRWVVQQGGGQSLSFNTANNRINSYGYVYDSAGNLSGDGLGYGYSYDAENRLTKLNNVEGYRYDGEGRRVRKLIGESVRFVYGISGELLAEYDGTTGALLKEHVYGASGLLASVVPNNLTGGGAQYATADHLGTPRVVTNGSGGVISRHDYRPYGEELAAGTGGRTSQQGYGVADMVRSRFTGQARDAESGLDYFGARYYAGGQGRFTSVDPLLASGEARRPQSWNRYSYCFDNPLRFTDPTGMSVERAQMPSADLGGGGGGGALSSTQSWTMEGVDGALNESVTVTVLDAIDASQNPQQAIVMNGTMEQEALIEAGHAEAERRVQQSSQCADLFGGTSKALSTLNNIAFTIDNSLPVSGHPQAIVGKGTFVYVNPNGGFLTPDGVSHTYYLVDPSSKVSNPKVFTLALTGAQARAFAEIHEGVHKAKGFKGGTDNDGGAGAKGLFNNYSNNWKVWSACFNKAVTKPYSGSGLPR